MIVRIYEYVFKVHQNSQKTHTRWNGTNSVLNGDNIDSLQLDHFSHPSGMWFGTFGLRGSSID